MLYKKGMNTIFDFIKPILSNLEHATGIEPAYSAWEANVLPMNYACK